MHVKSHRYRVATLQQQSGKPAMGPRSFAVLLCWLGMLFPLFSLSTMADQTKEQCRECCRRAGYQDYYLEQCLLRCHRNPQHCMLEQSTRGQPQEPTPTAQTVENPPDDQSQPAPQPRPRRTEPSFQWPNPLSLTPGKEIEAATHILVLNGIPQNHPQFPAAVKAVEAILVNFVRSNPAGGKLPTAQLERVLRQFRQ